MIRHCSEDYPNSSRIRWSNIVPARNISKFLEKRTERLDDFGYYYNLFLALHTDPFAKYLLKDLTTLFTELADIYEQALGFFDTSKNHYHDRLELYDTVIDSLRLIFQQRCSGIQIPNLLGLKNLNLESLGGTAKIIGAHESLVTHLLKIYGADWTGCSVFGYSHKFYWVTCGIINMPNTSKLQPEDWWGSGHETGHEAFYRLEQVNEGIYNAMAEEREKHLKAWEKDFYKEDSFALVWESFADAFDFNYDFFGDWDLYCQVVWAYLAKFYELNPNYLTRMLLVYFVYGPGTKENPKSQQKIVEVINKVVQQAKETNSEVNFSHDDKKEAIYKYLLLLNEFSLSTPAFANLPKLENESLKKIDEYLSNGVCVKVEPNVLVNCLMRNNRKGLKHHLAAILSLYNWSK